VKNLSQLPCQVRDLGFAYAASYNDVVAYRRACTEFPQLLERGRTGEEH
jgi:hypothetical protein